MKWQDHKPYSIIIENLKRDFPAEYNQLIDETPCFGWLWKDSDGEKCPETACLLRISCERVWAAAQTEITRKSKKPKKIVRKSNNRKKNKYKRVEYVSQGRATDSLSDAFFGVFDALEVSTGARALASNFKKPTIRRTASYHTLIANGIVSVRLWVNAPERANIDLIGELVTPVTNALIDLKPGFDYIKPSKLPEGSWKRNRPCTWRVTLFTEQSAELAAKSIKRKLRI